MALTKPRAYQIYDIDYKQATRVVTVTNVSLTGGAPNNVDGVTLSLNDRVLVTGQTDPTQNGIYIITTLGSGANGTWARSNDTNETGELLAGTIVMVTEGLIYADTQWKLITDNPIVIGTTPLTFTQNYLANVIQSGNSNVTVYSNANVTITAAGVANVLTVSNTGVAVLGTVNSTGNIIANTGSYFIGNGSQLSGINASSNKIYNGTSEANIGTADGNANISINGTSNVVVVSNVGLYVNGTASVSGNVTGNYYFGNGSQLTGVIASNSGNLVVLQRAGTLYVPIYYGTLVVLGRSGNINIPLAA
jgi:hypothetical protein